MVAMENNVIAKPLRIIWLILICPLAKTIALGGVATGIIKAQLAAIAVGIANKIGETPIETAKAPIKGKKVAAVAVLLVISVKKLIAATIKPTISRVGSIPMPEKLPAIHSDKPELVITPAKDKL